MQTKIVNPSGFAARCGAGRRHAIVVISENMTDVYQLAKEVEEYSGYECRATVLGYVQRGGTPTPEDRLLAARLGAYAVDLLKQGVSVLLNSMMFH